MTKTHRRRVGSTRSEASRIVHRDAISSIAPHHRPHTESTCHVSTAQANRMGGVSSNPRVVSESCSTVLSEAPAGPEAPYHEILGSSCGHLIVISSNPLAGESRSTELSLNRELRPPRHHTVCAHASREGLPAPNQRRTAKIGPHPLPRSLPSPRVRHARATSRLSRPHLSSCAAMHAGQRWLPACALQSTPLLHRWP